MAFEITYKPIRPIYGVSAKTVTRSNSREAWALVEGLLRGDEDCEIKFHGMSISCEDLKMRAAAGVDDWG